MERATPNYTLLFQRSLMPFFDMLSVYQESMPAAAWEALVRRTCASICNAPEQYFGNDLPAREEIAGIVHEAFDTFLMEAHVEEGSLTQ
ncbi:hypothetical protein [Chryseolinea lacunae]|uniref:Uncharacterized protein n=1 Tax=Chryseolinea lacunae TaxID=2801331 RepID=A0ABS1L1R1_9BACT|nr:hypothetical protein [Chryseolinea lacunae]MBL0745594.1 hypothetical protein [Chryseolinea lacunae]